MTVCAWGYLAVTRLPEPPWVSKIFLHFLTKLGRPFTKKRNKKGKKQKKQKKKQKVGSDRRVTTSRGRCSSLPEVDRPVRYGGLTLLAGLTFLHFGSPISWVNSVKTRQTQHARALLTRAKRSIFPHINAR